MGPICASASCSEPYADDVILGVKDHGQGGPGTNIVPHSGARVDINKQHLILFFRGSQNFILIWRIIDRMCE